MPVQILALLIGIVSTALGSVITLLISRRKNKAETLGIELDNANKVIQIWRDLAEEQDAKIEHLQQMVDELKIELEGLKRLYEAQCNNCMYRKEYLENRNKSEQ